MVSRNGSDRKEKKGGEKPGKGRTVLVVDDMKDNRLLLETVLKAKGYTVHLAANGEEALEGLSSHAVDLIISDILMPVMDGFQLCRACKDDKKLQGIPFVFYSATYTSEKDRDFALSLGAERFILKPAKPKVFLAAIEEVLAEHRDGTLVAGEGPTKEEGEILVLYNQRLINKLEDKMFELEDRNKLLESVFDHTHILVAYLDREFTIIRVNRAYADASGREPEYYSGKNLFEVLSDGTCEDVFRQVVTTGKPYFHTSHSFAFTEQKEGGMRYWDMGLIPIKNAEGSITHALLTLVEATERKSVNEELIVSKERYELCTRAGRVGVWDWDIVNGTFYLDPVIKDFLGYTDEEIPNELEKWVPYVHPDDSGPVMQAAQDCLDGKTPEYVYEHRMLHKDGSVRWVQVDGRVIRDEKGEPVRMLGTDTDITERRNAEEDVEYLSRFPEENPDPVLRISNKGIIIYSNEAGRKQILEPMGCRVGHPPKKQCVELISKATKGSKKGIFEIAIGDRLYSFVVAPVKGAGYTNLYAQDITERKKTEERLQEAFTIINRSASVAFTWRNMEGWPVEFVSDNVTALFGHSANDFLTGKVAYDKVVHPDDLARVAEEIATYSGEKDRTEFTHIPYRIISKDGAVRWVDDWTFIVRDAEGKVTHFKGIVTDITHRKRAEGELRRERDNLINMFESMRDGIYIVDKSHKIHYTNPVLVKEFGKYEGRKCYEYFHDRKRSCPWCKNKDVFAGKTVRWEWTSSKNKRTYDLIDTPMKGPDGQILKLEIFRDITDRKLAEGELERHRQHLEEMVAARTEELSEMGERFRQLFESSPDAVFVIGLTSNGKPGKFIEVNNVACERLGYTHEEMLALSPDDIHDRDVNWDLLPRMVKQIIASGQGVVRAVHVAKDGSRIPVEVRGSRIKLKGGSAIIAIARDVTDRERAEAVLRESAEEWKATFDAVDEMVFLQDRDMKIIRVNRAFAKGLGAEPDDFVGKYCYEVVHGTKEPPKECPHSHTLETGSPANAELFEPKLGRHLEVSVSPIYDDKGKVCSTVHVARDITERVQAEGALRESEERYRTLFESVPVGIGIATRDGRAIAGNSTICSLMGYTLEELKRRSITDVYRNPDDRQRIMRLLSQDGHVNGEGVEMVRKDGSTFIASLTVMPFTAAGEDVNFTLIEDITERVRSEERLRWQLMRFRLDEGGTYLVKESAPTVAIEAFADLMKAGHPGHVVSRTPSVEHSLDVSTLSSFMWLAEIEGEGTVPPRVDVLVSRLDALPDKSAVLIDRLDYLALKNGTDATLGFVQHVRELAYLRRHIIVLSLDPAAVDKHLLHLLEKETLEVERQVGGALGEDLLEVLRYIRRENMTGLKPSYTEVAGGVGLSRPTVLVRMKRLEAAGYVVVHKTGRRKAVELTERGRRLFER